MGLPLLSAAAGPPQGAAAEDVPLQKAGEQFPVEACVVAGQKAPACPGPGCPGARRHRGAEGAVFRHHHLVEAELPDRGVQHPLRRHHQHPQAHHGIRRLAGRLKGAAVQGRTACISQQLLLSKPAAGPAANKIRSIMFSAFLKMFP